MESPDAECDGAITVAYPSQNPGLTEVVAHCFPPGTLDRMYSPYPVTLPRQLTVGRAVPAFMSETLEDIEPLDPDAD